MQKVSTGDNLHEMSNPVFWEIYKKYFNMSSAENFIQSAKHLKHNSNTPARIVPYLSLHF